MPLPRITLISQSTRKTHRNSEHPSKRWGHSVIIHKNQMIIFGGRHSQRSLSNIYSLDFTSLTWLKIEQIGISPPARDSHSAITYNNEMIIFGGSGSGNKLNDIWSFNFNDKRWTKVETIGENPCARDGHLCSVIDNNYMMIYSGLNSLDEVISSTNLLDLRNNYWILCQNEGDEIPKRDSQSSTKVNETIFIFGGQAPNDELYNDMYTLNFDINEEKKIYKAVFKKEIIKDNSPLPKGRSSHSCVNYDNKYLIIIGGEGEKKIPLDDIWLYDIENKCYIQVNLNGHEKFEGRFCHSSIIFGDTLAIYGGMQNAEVTLDSLVILSIDNNNKKLENGDNNNKNINKKNKGIDMEDNEYGKGKKNVIMNDVSLDTDDLINMDFYSFNELKKNYVNNLITWNFLTKISEYNEWGIGCIGNFIMNSLKDYVESKNIFIESKNYNENEIYICIKDDGKGMNFIEFNSIMYSFSKNENKEINYFQYGITMKTSALRLADSFFIISKCSNEISIGLISKNLQKKIDSDFILTPVINYKINFENDNDKENKDKEDYIPKSDYPLQSLNLILEEIKFLFKTPEELINYFKSFQTGTHIFLYDLKKINDNYEFTFDKEQHDIFCNVYFDELGFDEQSKKELIDISLSQYLNFIQLKHSKEVKIFIEGEEKKLENPYYNIFLMSGINNNNLKKIAYLKYEGGDKIDCFNICGEDYKGILFNEKFLNGITENTNFAVEDIKEKDYFNGILLYKENYLICRIGQSTFGDLSFFIKKFLNGKKGKDIFKINGYIQLPNKGYDLMFNNKEIKDLALFGFLYNKIKGLTSKINK